jgi:tetratricopeptide (TPR) repeat protein
MKPVFILDTNALLHDPKIIYTFPESLIIIPQTVLTELDKLKTTRASKELLFRGREVSRILFSLSDQGNLSEGIPIKNGSMLKVIALDKSKPLPESLSAKNSDDCILGLAYQLIKQHGKENVTLITNDLNMLLKAQTLDVPVEKCLEIRGERLRALWQGIVARKKLILWAVVPIVLFLATIGLMSIFNIGPFKGEITLSGLPPEIRAFKEREQTYLGLIETNPKDINALVGLGNLYFDFQQFQLAANMYERALKIDPTNTYVRTDLGVAYFNLGLTDIAIREFQKVLKDNPKHVTAHYNLGIALWKGKGDLDGAKKEFQKCVELAPKEEFAHAATQNIKQIDELLKSQKGGE